MSLEAKLQLILFFLCQLQLIFSYSCCSFSSFSDLLFIRFVLSCCSFSFHLVVLSHLIRILVFFLISSWCSFSSDRIVLSQLFVLFFIPLLCSRLSCTSWSPAYTLLRQDYLLHLPPAYEVLSDQEKRRVYDTHGEEGLKQQKGQGQRRGGFNDIFSS